MKTPLGLKQLYRNCKDEGLGPWLIIVGVCLIVIVVALVGSSQGQVIVELSPNYPTVTSGSSLEFTATVLNSTDAKVLWGSCGGTLSDVTDTTAMFTAPTVTKTSSICVYALADADPSKSATSYVSVKPAKATCPTVSPYLDSSTIYSLPSYVTALTWVQPADTIYPTSKLKKSSSPLDRNLPSINTRAGDKTQFCGWLMVQGGTSPYTYSVTGAPPGLKVNAGTGQYSGVATAPGRYTVTFCATDAAGTKACLAPRTQVVCDGGTTQCSL